MLLALDDIELTLLMAAAAPVPRERRGAFLQDLAAGLTRVEMSEGDLHKAITAAQQRYLGGGHRMIERLWTWVDAEAGDVIVAQLSDTFLPLIATTKAEARAMRGTAQDYGRERNVRVALLEWSGRCVLETSEGKSELESVPSR
jgi:hypothetical protein